VEPTQVEHLKEDPL
jgi:hypothetical protein